MEITKQSLLEYALSEDGAKLLRVECPMDNLHPYQIEDMSRAIEFVKDPKNGAAGLAAPQMGISSPWFAMKRKNGTIIVIAAPKIIGKMGKKQYIEGCFSEKFLARVTRAKSVTVDYILVTIDEHKFIATPNVRETFEGVDAQVFQHEYDHIKGRLICDIGEPIV